MMKGALISVACEFVNSPGVGPPGGWIKRCLAGVGGLDASMPCSMDGMVFLFMVQLSRAINGNDSDDS